MQGPHNSNSLRGMSSGAAHQTSQLALSSETLTVDLLDMLFASTFAPNTFVLIVRDCRILWRDC